MSSPKPRLYASTVVLILLASVVGNLLGAQDLTTNSGVFLPRPDNPPIRRRAKKVGMTAGAQKNKTTVKPTAPKQVIEEEEEDPSAYSPNEFSEEVEAALTRGN